MTAVLVDSNVLLDVLGDDLRWGAWSSSKLEEVAETRRLVINPVIYAEVSVRFTRIEDLDEVLPQSTFERQSLPYEAAFLAGKVHLAYRRRGGEKRSPLPDFFIGAHAAVAGYPLLTRDTERYRTFFPRLRLIAPSA